MMDSVFTNITNVKNSYWEFKGQEDFIDKWFLMSSPAPVAIISVAYLLFVLKIGPSSMKNRPAFKLNNFLVIYNFVQVLVSTYIFTCGLKLLWSKGLVYKTCMLNQQEALNVASAIYLYFIAKVSELLDTIFFVLRKKNNQVTFLHVYHHSIMLLLSWYTLKYEPTYTTVFLGTLNCLVHIIMYTYYGLSAFPDMAKYLWWKKYITSMQLVQFLLVIIQNCVNYAWSGCKPSFFTINMIITNALLFIYLFGDFYLKSYTKNRSYKTNVSTQKNVNSRKVKIVEISGMGIGKYGNRKLVLSSP